MSDRRVKIDPHTSWLPTFSPVMKLFQNADFYLFSPQSRQSAKLFSSLELGLPQPLARRRVCPLPPLIRGEGHTRWRKRDWESPNSDEGTYTVVGTLYIYVLCDSAPPWRRPQLPPPQPWRPLTAARRLPWPLTETTRRLTETTRRLTETPPRRRLTELDHYCGSESTCFGASRIRIH